MYTNTYVELNSATNVQSYYFYLRLNVRMIFVLLQVLSPELGDPVTGEDLPNFSNETQPDKAHDKITAITRRILPALRQYSTWLVSQAHILVAKHPGSTSVYIKELWKMFADVATALITYFPDTELPSLDYLLEEDQTTVGFKPLRDPELAPNANLYIDEKGMLKARCTDPGVERSHPNIEMKGRVRDILLCAVTLATRDDSPLSVENGRVVFVEEGLQHLSPVTATTAKDSASTHTSPTRMTVNFTLPSAQQQREGNPEGSIAASDSHQSMDTDMHRMVDDLLEPPSGQFAGSNETSYGMHSRTANEIFAPMANYTNQHLRQTTPKMLPSLWNSPFTPQPNELQASSPDRPTTTRQLSPLQLSTPQQQIEAATVLNTRTGYTAYNRNSWGRKPFTPGATQMSAPVNQLLHKSLGQQHQPMSSNFTDSSSIYANGTPRQQPGLRDRLVSTANGNNSTFYPGGSDFDMETMLQSSLWSGSQAGRGSYTQTPPGGQGG